MYTAQVVAIEEEFSTTLDKLAAQLAESDKVSPRDQMEWENKRVEREKKKKKEGKKGLLLLLLLLAVLSFQPPRVFSFCFLFCFIYFCMYAGSQTSYCTTCFLICGPSLKPPRRSKIRKWPNSATCSPSAPVIWSSRRRRWCPWSRSSLC